MMNYLYSSLHFSEYLVTNGYLVDIVLYTYIYILFYYFILKLLLPFNLFPPTLVNA